SYAVSLLCGRRQHGEGVQQAAVVRRGVLFAQSCSNIEHAEQPKQLGLAHERHGQRAARRAYSRQRQRMQLQLLHPHHALCAQEGGDTGISGISWCIHGILPCRIPRWRHGAMALEHYWWHQYRTLRPSEKRYEKRYVAGNANVG